MQPAIFLDRDNTLIANDGDLGDPEQVHLIDGVAPGLRALRDAGYRLVVTTNQGGVARGKYTESEVDAVHLRIAELVDQAAQRRNLIDRFYYCPYHPEATVAEYRRDHPWRKPHPGMMVQAARDLGIDLGGSWLIGDQVRDIEAGRAAGCRTVLVGAAQSEIEEARPSFSVSHFEEAVELILREGKRSTAGSPNRPNGIANSLRESGDDPPGGEGPSLRLFEASAPVLTELASIRRAVHDLTEEMRGEHRRRGEFTPLRMTAGVAQLLVLLLVLLGLMQVGQTDVYLKWLVGAGLAQLLTIAILVADRG